MLPEERAIAKLRGAPYAIGDEEIAALGEFFRQLGLIDERVTAASPTELYESQWALLGIVSRSYQLMLCCVEQIAGRSVSRPTTTGGRMPRSDARLFNRKRYQVVTFSIRARRMRLTSGCAEIASTWAGVSSA